MTASTLELGVGEPSLRFLFSGRWESLDWSPTGTTTWKAEHALGVKAQLSLTPHAEDWDYTLSFTAPWPTRLRFSLTPLHCRQPFHLIPANLHGDNALAQGEAGHFPNLTDQPAETPFSASLWEFRADRAPCPISALCDEAGVVAMSIQPYSESAEQRSGFLANGLFAELPATIGVALGYGNDPVSFINREEAGAPTCHRSTQAKASGRIYKRSGDRRAVHAIIREEYSRRRECPTPTQPTAIAARALADALVQINYQPEWKAYSNQRLNLKGDPRLRAWRPLLEIGWTAGGPLAYPLIRAQRQLQLPADFFPESGSGQALLDQVAAARNPASGWLYDLTQPWRIGEPPGNHVNGWWSGYGLCRDVHCAYTNGSAVYYLLKSALDLRQSGQAVPAAWIDAARGTLDTAISLQRADGNFGFSYALDTPRVVDWQGFAGAWLAAACALADQWEPEPRYRAAAEKALPFYHRFVCELSCWGTPMDTWKSVDEEGNLAFMKLARHLHESTGSAESLSAAVDGAHYEMLWRYGYRTRPPAPPLSEANWNSCGGSITSVSNPHAHPMGLIVTGDLLWLAQVTGDLYWRDRAEDGVCWIRQCMELYPRHSRGAAYGVLTERFCPSDGLLIERYDDGTPSSLWFSYNGWAAAAALEGILDWMELSPN